MNEILTRSRVARHDPVLLSLRDVVQQRHQLIEGVGLGPLLPADCADMLHLVSRKGGGAGADAGLLRLGTTGRSNNFHGYIGLKWICILTLLC